jgi:hypothetical protein
MGTRASVQQSAALPPQLILYQMATGHYLSRALNLAAKLGIADLFQTCEAPTCARSHLLGPMGPLPWKVVRYVGGQMSDAPNPCDRTKLDR